jgi:hypothetical protein
MRLELSTDFEVNRFGQANIQQHQFKRIADGGMLGQFTAKSSAHLLTFFVENVLQQLEGNRGVIHGKYFALMS